jgi:uncharacterized membrane protein YcjF (UPF0283 family)
VSSGEGVVTGLLALLFVFAAMSLCNPLLGLLAVSPWVVQTCWEALR